MDAWENILVAWKLVMCIFVVGSVGNNIMYKYTVAKYTDYVGKLFRYREKLYW